ncbi:MAG: T9SS type A sorting domain-containing protein [Rhodothermales bacterium]
MNRYPSLLLLIAGLAVCSTTRAQFASPSGVFGSGAISTENASFRLDATFGQPMAGWSGGNIYAVEIGFWFTVPDVGTAIEEVASDAVPARFRLEQNYPNPFNPATTIRYALPRAGPVRLVVYDVRGREVTTLVDRQQAPGTYAVDLDATSLPSGVYFYRMEADGFVEARSMLLVK